MDPDPVRILPVPGWFNGSRTSDTKSMKKEYFKIIRNIHSIEFRKSPFVRGTEPRIQIWKNPDPHPWKHRDKSRPFNV